MRTSAPDLFKILLVDDNRDGLLVRRTLLQEFGHAVEIAGNGDEALGMFTSSHFDIVVTDHCMPRMDGKQLIQRIRSVNPDARVILLSGYAEELGLTEENTGANVVLVKSSREGAQLLRAVKRLMSTTLKRKPAASQKKAPVKARSLVR